VRAAGVPEQGKWWI